MNSVDLTPYHPTMTANGQTFTEFNIPTAQSMPYGITSGPDGNLWFTEFASNIIGRINLPQEFPVPDIKANNSNGPITVSQKNPLSITIKLDAGTHSGENADWWIVAVTPVGVYSYNLGNNSWSPGLATAKQGPLIDMATTEVLNRSGLPIGSYTIYFGVDMIMNGSLDMDKAYYDSIDVNITQ